MTSVVLPVVETGPEALLRMSELTVSDDGEFRGSMPVGPWLEVERRTPAGAVAVLVDDLLGYAIVADRVGKVWGLGSDTKKDPGPWEGEQRNMWKPTQVDNLWMHGGNLHQSRHYSLYLALQLKARYEGIDTPVYALQEVHHTA